MTTEAASHETRIQRVEDAIMTNRATLEGHSVTLGHIQASVDQTKVAIERKIEEGLDSIKKEIARTAKSVGDLALVVGANQERLKVIEEARAAEERRNKTIKAVAIWTVAGMGGVFIKMMAEWLVVVWRQ